MSAIFLHSVCLTYLRRKYTTRVDPHVHDSITVVPPTQEDAVLTVGRILLRVRNITQESLV